MLRHFLKKGERCYNLRLTGVLTPPLLSGYSSALLYLSTERCAGANKSASPPGRQQEQASKQRCTFRRATFSSAQFSQPPKKKCLRESILARTTPFLYRSQPTALLLAGAFLAQVSRAPVPRALRTWCVEGEYVRSAAGVERTTSVHAN